MSINASIHLESPVGVFPRQVNSTDRRALFTSEKTPAAPKVAPPPPFLSVLWSYRDIWFTPLACEAVLFLCALHLSLILARIMESGALSWLDWLPVAIGAAAYAAGKIESEKEELFMTRFVTISGVGGLVLIAVLVMTLITVIAPSLLGTMGLHRRMVLMLPLGIFLFREAMLIHASRFAPSMASMSLRHNRPVGVVARLRQCLHYWMH